MQKDAIMEGFSAGLWSQNTNCGRKSVYSSTLEELAWSRLVRESACFPDRSEEKSQVPLTFCGSNFLISRSELNLPKKHSYVTIYSIFLKVLTSLKADCFTLDWSTSAFAKLNWQLQRGKSRTEYGKTAVYTPASSLVRLKHFGAWSSVLMAAC